MHRITLVAVFVTALSACGGGSSPSPAAPPTTLNGVVASGAPLAGASVVVIDSDAATTDPAAVTAAADGSYSINVSGLIAPFLIQATAIVEGTSTTTVAVVPSVTANANNTANITPLTNAVAALIAPGGNLQALLVPATLGSNATAQKVGDATALLVNTLATDPVVAAALGANFNPLTTGFAANGSGVDGVLDQLAVEVSAAGVSITNLASPLSGNGVQAPVTLTQAQTATPTIVPTLPPSAAIGSLPTAAELAALGAKFEACLALPVAQRVTLDSAGIVTAVSATCNYAPSDWKSNGRTWAQELGQFTFAKNQLTGAKVGKGIVVLTLAPDNLTDPKEFKHPYCNSATCVVVRFPLTSASNQATASDWVIGKIGTAWDFVGNQRPYRTFAETRMRRMIATNLAGAAPGNTADPYFFSNRYESTIRMIFDLNSPGTNDVRAVRFTGPGLPAAGLVLFRSDRCGTDDFMGITYQNGSTRRLSDSAFVFFTGSSAAEFVLDAANLDGTPLVMPVPVLNATTASNQNFSPSAVVSQSSVIPAWSRYKIEIFRFSALSDTPDEILYTRINAAAENATLGTSKPWPTLAQSFIESYLTPTGASAGTIGTLAHNTSWTIPAGSYVHFSYLFSQNFLTLANGTGDAAANYGLRTRLDFEPLALGDLSAPATEFASVVAGTSLSTFTSIAGSNPNPRCTSPNLVPLTSSTSDYRETGLQFRGADRKLYNSVWFWDN